ncbi:MAG TPA: hypothetical protein VGK52_10535 [Polyangia bacterium]|jgi:hypothetical protein
MSHSQGWTYRVVGLVGIGAAALGCGGVTAASPDAGNDAPAEAGPPLTTADGCTNVATALCNSLDACAPVAVQVLYGDKSTCVSRAVLSCTTDQSVEGIARTANDLASCAAALSGATCDDLLAGTFPSVCTAKPGTVVNGMACGSDLQCASTFCNKTDACGVCSPRQAAGGDCAVDGGCVSGLVCASKKCVAPAGPGGDCNLPNQPCRSDLYCPTMNGSAKCAAKLGAGGACTDSDQACDLAKGVICNPLTHVCDPIKVAKGGEACSLASKTLCVGFVAPCSSFLTGGVCANPAQDGETCGGNAVCVPPATCQNKICRLPSAPDCR